MQNTISIHPKRQRLLRLVNLSQPTRIVDFFEPTGVRSGHSSYQWLLHCECPSKLWFCITRYILKRPQKQGESVQNTDSFIEGKNQNHERIMIDVNSRVRQKNIIPLSCQEMEEREGGERLGKRNQLPIHFAVHVRQCLTFEGVGTVLWMILSL